MKSQIEAEYISAAETTNQVIWLRKMISNVGQIQVAMTVIWVANKSAICYNKRILFTMEGLSTSK